MFRAESRARERRGTQENLPPFVQARTPAPVAHAPVPMRLSIYFEIGVSATISD